MTVTTAYRLLIYQLQLLGMENDRFFNHYTYLPRLIFDSMFCVRLLSRPYEQAVEPFQLGRYLAAMLYSQLWYQLLPIVHFPNSSRVQDSLKMHVRRKDALGILRQSLTHELAYAT